MESLNGFALLVQLVLDDEFLLLQGTDQLAVQLRVDLAHMPHFAELLWNAARTPQGLTR